MDTLDSFSQYAILILGTLAIGLLNLKNRWGIVAGIASQPFWFHTTYVHEQWPMFWFNIVCTISWCMGFYTWFLKKEQKSPQ